MPDSTPTHAQAAMAPQAGWQSLVADWSSDQRAFKSASWGRP
ncbi:hypothetical protein ACFQU2_09950 [Siccirubricoccus deserti]